MQHEISFTDFAHVSSLLISNNRVKKWYIPKELSEFGKSNISVVNLRRVIFAFSKKYLFDCQKKASCKSFKFQFIY